MTISVNPKVSIIVPVYNGSNYLREAIDSALKQTYKNIEIIVVNDGSRDNGATEGIASSYGNKLRYYYKENGGVASALNLGILHMEGEYFSWLSHDDVYCSDKIEKQIDYLRNAKRDVILYSDYDLIDQYSRFICAKKIDYIEPSKFRYALVTSWPIHGCTLLIPRKCLDEIGPFNEKLKTTQDYDMWFRMARKYDFIHINKSLISSRVHSEQGTANMSRVHLDELDELYIGMLKNINADTLCLKDETLGLFYARMAIPLKSKCSVGAANFALVRSFQYSLKGGWGSFIKNLLLIIFGIMSKPMATAQYFRRKLH